MEGYSVIRSLFDIIIYGSDTIYENFYGEVDLKIVFEVFRSLHFMSV